MKSWISVFLPDDEYKRERVIFFLAEGGVLLLIYFVVALMINELLSQNWTTQLVVLIGLGLYATYTTLRYSLSGIEFTDVARSKDFKKQQKKLVYQSIIYFIIFAMMSILLSSNDWFTTIIFALVGALILFFLNYTSLKKSYTKNKELID
ncbi:hypothetical protein [Alkalicoccobacillus gibsonii]|uniref:hypothetical protein n=1 Tax=Alkalicoccobacillus gibsonii TaxID=79881 RepID=UPI001933A57D|nr:hypothetical protein [Alkalicoccobacillus gibsonii]MBM0066965.1 hypothetical protein [Alkalicoccobacillus gibsonii]